MECTSKPGRFPYPTAEEYQVYSMILDSLCDQGPVVIADSTTKLDEFYPNGDLVSPSLSIKDSDLEVDVSLHDDFYRKNSVRWSLAPYSFKTKVSVLLMSDYPQLEKFIDSLRSVGLTKDGWGRHVISFSRVGFNFTRSRAIVLSGFE